MDCDTRVLPPSYLKDSDTYDLSAIVDPEHWGSIQRFDCLRPEAWPRKELLGLDASQMKALQLALTNELAIIQGPPGTGNARVFTMLFLSSSELTTLNPSSLWVKS